MFQEKWKRLYRETKWGTLLGVSYVNKSSLLKRYMKSKCWGSGPLGCCLPLPHSHESVSLPVRHSMSSCTGGEQVRSQLCWGGKKWETEGEQAIQRNFFIPAKLVPWKTYGLWFLYGFWHIVSIKRKKKETLQNLQTLNTMSWQWKMQLSHSNNMPVSE